MKLRFEADLDYQLRAIRAVCDLFKGQEAEVAATGNHLTLTDAQLLANLRAVQRANGLPADAALESRDFTIEMETGTGKTYVYLRTILELHARFGFTKFAIVVPSVAIREGVAKTIEMTAGHFRALYAGVPVEAFTYDGAKLGQVQDFAGAAAIRIMIGTIAAFNKLDGNVFHTAHERTGSARPVDLVRATRPILILDEPQSIEGADANSAGRRALAAMDPLCTLRYSATHRRACHRIYRLDAIDAYERGLVKRIEVAGAEATGAGDAPYARLVSVRTARGRPPVATLELDVQGADGVRRTTATVRDGDDLAAITGRDAYRGVSVGTIEGGRGRECVQLNLPGEAVRLRPGEAHGDLDPDMVASRMIERTIREHFERELLLRPLGIKVLSLFFIDRVEHYRGRAADGGPALGRYGRMFEDAYRRLAAHPDFRDSLFAGREPDAAAVHGGYFSVDRKGRPVETELTATGAFRTARGREEAERAFRLIMRDKERLLDEAEPLRFLFSHSALREGWDNPNVFQICALRGMNSVRERRQTIGRGLRLCVDAHGERRREDRLNVLTVIADEPFEAFADGLQKEMEEEFGIRFGTIAPGAFAALASDAGDGARPLGAAASAALVEHLRGQGLIDAEGRILEPLRAALSGGDALVLPARFVAVAEQACALLRRLAGRVPVRDADARRPVPLNEANYHGEAFAALWRAVGRRTAYRLDFDPEALIRDAAERIRRAPAVAPAGLRWRKAELRMGRDGIAPGDGMAAEFAPVPSAPARLPDVLNALQERTGLTRASLARILVGSGRLDALWESPAAFLDQAADLIGRAKGTAMVDGIRYEALDGDDAYPRELFAATLPAGTRETMVKTTKSVHRAVIVDSAADRAFAEALDRSEAVQLFVRLPAGFHVPTPFGTCRPDWAVLAIAPDGGRLAIVVDSGGATGWEEAARTHCAERHFAALARANGGPVFVSCRTAEEALAHAVRAGGPRRG